MDEQRYHEILPTAYMTAALKMGGKTASEMARLWLASRKKRINGCYMEDALEHLS